MPNAGKAAVPNTLMQLTPELALSHSNASRCGSHDAVGYVGPHSENEKVPVRMLVAAAVSKCVQPVKCGPLGAGGTSTTTPPSTTNGPPSAWITTAAPGPPAAPA